MIPQNELEDLVAYYDRLIQRGKEKLLEMKSEITESEIQQAITKGLVQLLKSKLCDKKTN